MSEQRHKAFSTLEDREVNGYAIQIVEAGEWGVRPQVTKQYRTPIAFTVEAAEHKFETTAVLNDLGQELAQLIQEAELGPKGEYSAIFAIDVWMRKPLIDLIPNYLPALPAASRIVSAWS